MTEHVHVSDLRWDRLLAGELAAEAKAEVLAAADACATCAARLAEIRRDSEAFAARPPLVVAQPRARRWWLVAPALAAAAAVLVFVRLRTEPQPHDGRTKGGGVQLLVAVGSPGHVAVIASGDRVHPGDHVQAGYTAERAGFGAVLGKDGSGKAASYVPAQGDAMIALPPGTERSFPASTVLDEVPGDETLIVVWCEAIHPLAPLVAELEARGDITPPAGCTHRQIVLRKEPR